MDILHIDLYTALDLFMHGNWHIGYEHWNGKPKLQLGFNFYDWWYFTMHIGKLWIECAYCDDEDYG